MTRAAMEAEVERLKVKLNEVVGPDADARRTDDAGTTDGAVYGAGTRQDDYAGAVGQEFL